VILFYRSVATIEIIDIRKNVPNFIPISAFATIISQAPFFWSVKQQTWNFMLFHKQAFQ